MNALIIKKLPDGTGVDIDLKTDPADSEAKMFVEWLYKLIYEMENRCPNLEVTQ